MQIRFSLGHVICKLRGPRGKKHGGDVVTKAVQLNQRKRLTRDIFYWCTG